MSEKTKWQDMEKEELFMLAKWHESRAEAFKEIIALLETEPNAFKYEVSVKDEKEQS